MIYTLLTGFAVNIIEANIYGYKLAIVWLGLRNRVSEFHGHKVTCMHIKIKLVK